MNDPKSAPRQSPDPPCTLIYVVDDESQLLELASSILAPCGYNITTFTDPHIALSDFTNTFNPPALLIVDCVMPSMNGLDLMTACRQVRPRQKVLFIGDSEPLSAFPHRLLYSLQPTALLLKPYRPRHLRDTVRAFLADDS